MTGYSTPDSDFVLLRERLGSSTDEIVEAFVAEFVAASRIPATRSRDLAAGLIIRLTDDEVRAEFPYMGGFPRLFGEDLRWEHEHQGPTPWASP